MVKYDIYCEVSKENVHNAHTEKDLKMRVGNWECVSTIYLGISYRRRRVKGMVFPLEYHRDKDEDNPYNDRRNNPDIYSERFMKCSRFCYF